MGRLVAVVLAWLVFVTFARGVHVWRRMKIDNPSPVDAAWVWEWVKALVSRDPDPEPAPEPDPAGYQLVPDEEIPPRTRVVWAKREPGDPEPAAPAPGPRPSRLDRWVAQSLDAGARPVDVITEGRRLFRCSDTTVKRAIRRVRGARERSRSAVRADA